MNTYKRNTKELESLITNRRQFDIGNRYFTNSYESGILSKSVLELTELSQSEKDRIWDTFGNYRFSNLIADDNWYRSISNYFSPDDTLDLILGLSISYLYCLCSDDSTFHETLELLLNRFNYDIGHRVFINLANTTSEVPIFDGIELEQLGGLFISPSFIPKSLLTSLNSYGISYWDQLNMISESKVAQKYGNSISTVLFIVHLYLIRCSCAKLAYLIQSNLNDLKKASSFDTYLRHWLQEIVEPVPERNIVIFCKRRGWDTGEQKTLEAIGQEYDVTRERVRQIESKIFRKLGNGNVNYLIGSLAGLWIIMDAIVNRYAGILSAQELGQQIQQLLNWEKPVSILAIKELVEYAPIILFENRLLQTHCIIMSRLHIEKGCADCREVINELTKIYSTLPETAASDALEQMGDICRDSCPKRNTIFGHYTTALIDYLILIDEKISRILAKREGKYYPAESITHKYGSLSKLIENILERSSTPLHFENIYDQIAKFRPGDNSISKRYVHAALSSSKYALLWDRGTFIHRKFINFPGALLSEIDEWIVSALKTDVPFISISGVFAAYYERCITEGITTETALYTCLKETCNELVLSFPHYPQILLGYSRERKSSVMAVEEYIEEVGGEVAMSELHRQFITNMRMKQFQLSNALSNNPNIIRTSGQNLIHASNLHIGVNTKYWKTSFREIVDYAVQSMNRTGHMSIRKIFDDKVVKCKTIGIQTPELLYGLFRLYAQDTINTIRYPQIAITEHEQQLKILNINETISDYIRSKNDICTFSELEKHFVDERGYSPVTVINIRYNPLILEYIPGALIHKEVLKWDGAKQGELEECALSVYKDALNIGQHLVTILQVLDTELDQLPSIPEKLTYTPTLIADLLASNGRFLLLGNAKKAYVPVDNPDNIASLGDLLHLLLKEKFSGACNLREFQAYLVELGVIIKTLTPTMIDGYSKIIIHNDEIMLAELLAHA